MNCLISLILGRNYEITPYKKLAGSSWPIHHQSPPGESGINSTTTVHIFFEFILFYLFFFIYSSDCTFLLLQGSSIFLIYFAHIPQFPPHSQHQRIVMHPAPVQHMHRFRRPTHIKTTDPFKPTPASFVHVHIDAFQTAARGHFNRTTPSTSCHPSGVGTARTVGFPFHPIRQR